MSINIPSDIQDRARALNDRVNAGEAMSLQHVADALGLPFEFVAVAIGLTEVLMTGRPVLINPAELPKVN